MDIDIGFWLSLAVLVGIVAWVLDKSLKIRKSEKPKALRESVDFFISMLPVFLVVLLVRTFLFEPFTIPSGSMLPTLKVGDFILVNKFAYGLRTPVTHTRILETGTPQVGDIVVFRFPKNTSINYIKRVVGVGGDQILIRNGEIEINGEPVARRVSGQRNTLEGYEATFIEQLGDKTHWIRHQWRRNPNTGLMVSYAPEGQWTVPEGHYFVMGDNRDDSEDSRSWGFVADEHIAGKAVYRWMYWPTLTSLPSFKRNGSLDTVEW